MPTNHEINVETWEAEAKEKASTHSLAAVREALKHYAEQPDFFRQGVQINDTFYAKSAIAILDLLLAAPEAEKEVRGDIPSERDRHEEWQALTRGLPCVSKVAHAGWLWNEEEIEMLRAASKARFGESIRTETLFAIAMTGIRIYLSRTPTQPPSDAEKPKVSLESLAKIVCAADGFNPDGACTIQNDVAREQWEPYLDYAQAVLNHLKEKGVQMYVTND